MPHARATLGSFSWQRLTGYWPGCLSFPTQDWHWPLQRVLPIISCCPSVTLPCSLCSQLTWSLLALATCQDTSQQPPRCFSCSESCTEPEGITASEKNLFSERMFFFHPCLKTHKKPTHQESKKMSSNLYSLCLLNTSSSQASFEFCWFTCVLINACFSHLYNMMPGSGEMTLFQNVNVNLDLIIYQF